MMSPAMFEDAPAALRLRPQWVLWKAETPAGADRPTKVPYRVNGARASSTNPATWAGFHAVCRTFARGGYTGIGYVFSAGDPFVFVDLDHCRDAATGALSPRAEALVRDFATYAEVSPSGTGLHLFCRGAITGDWHKRDGVEIYASGRFSTITGDRLPSSPPDVAFVNGPLDALYASLAPQPREKQGVGIQEETGAVALTDEEVIRRAAACSYGPAFTALLAGDTSAYGGDESAADLALCGYLAFWCGNDAAQIDRIFRRSGLFRPKWESRRGHETYGARTLARAWSAEVYSSQPREKQGVGIQERNEELQALRAELAAARMTITAQAAKLDEQETLLARIDAEGRGAELERLREEVALWKARYRTLVAVAECPDLSHKDRTVTAVALELSGVVRAPPSFGTVAAPMEPVHVRMGELEKRAGIAAGGAAPSLKKAAALGFLTRTVDWEDRKRPDGSAEPRMRVAIGPGTGVVDGKLREEQRTKEAVARRLAREAKERREAADLAAAAERRLAAERAEAGCLCGGDLLPTGYVCADPACLVHYSPAEVNALPAHTRRPLMGGDTVLPRPVAASPRPESPTPEKTPDRSNTYIPPVFRGVGPPRDPWLEAGDGRSF